MKIVREIWDRVNKRVEEIKRYSGDPRREERIKIAERLNLTRKYFEKHSIEFDSNFNDIFQKVFTSLIDTLGRRGEDFKDLYKVREDFRNEIERVIRESIHNNKAGGPHPGVFIVASDIINKGSITGPTVEIIANKYEGSGEVSAFNKDGERKSDRKEIGFFEKLTNNQTFAIVIGAILILSILFLIFKFTGVDLSRFN